MLRLLLAFATSLVWAKEAPDALELLRAERGQGSRAAVPGSREAVGAALELMAENHRKSGAEWSVLREGDAWYVTYRTGRISMGFAYFLYPSKEPGKMDVEVLYASNVKMPEDKRREMQERMLGAMPDMVGYAAYKNNGGAPSSPSVQPAAPPAAPPPARPASDVSSLGKKLKAREDDFALVVGISGYQALPPADNAEADAAAVRAFMLDLGVPEENVVHLAGSAATRTGLAKYLEEWLPRNATPESRVWVYFSGHGAPDPKTGAAHLVPWDGDPSFLKTSAYPVARLYERLQALKAKEVVVLLDACFSGAGGRSVLAKGARPLVTQAKASAPGPRVSVLAASAADEITGSMEGKGHGLFTYFLLKGLQGEADANKDGHVSLSEMHAYAKKNVSRAARRQNREQSPQLFAADPALPLY